MVTEVQRPARTGCVVDAAAGPARDERDPACLLWLGRRPHVCRSESGGALDPSGGSCASWDRVQMARRYAAANSRDGNVHLAAVRDTLALLAEIRSLLRSGVPWAGTPDRLAPSLGCVAQAFLRADQAVTLAGWYHPAQ